MAAPFGQSRRGCPADRKNDQPGGGQALEWAKHQLQSNQTRVLIETSSDAGYKTFCLEDPELVFAEKNLHPFTGMELLARIRKHSPNALVILTSAFGTTQSVIEAMKMGAFDFVRKEQLPFNLKVVADAALQAAAEVKAANAFKPQLTVEQHRDEIVGRSEAMQQPYLILLKHQRHLTLAQRKTVVQWTS